MVAGFWELAWVVLGLPWSVFGMWVGELEGGVRGKGGKGGAGVRRGLVVEGGEGEMGVWRVLISCRVSVFDVFVRISGFWCNISRYTLPKPETLSFFKAE